MQCIKKSYILVIFVYQNIVTMDRREFLASSAAALAGLALGGASNPLFAKKADRDYNMILLGDTHFDVAPESVYHSEYTEEDLARLERHRKEFVRNGEMWKERCPRMLKRAGCLVDEQTKMVLQAGDLIQGDCGNPLIHKKMLSDAVARIKEELSPVPLVSVIGNHDMRGTGARKAYLEFMPELLSRELGKVIDGSTFSFEVGDDVYIVMDFNKPDDALIDRLLDDSRDARNTFLLSHGPVLPINGGNRWFFHGRNKPGQNEARLHFRREFAQRNTIVICGHTHVTEMIDWYGDGGRITQMTVSSVWSKPERGVYEVEAEGSENYRADYVLKANSAKMDPSAFELFEQYRPGVKRYILSDAAGSYKMKVSGRRVRIEFYAGDSSRKSAEFVLR